jgi:hypothetical protein
MYHEIENFRGDVNSATLIAQIPDMIVTWTGFLFQKLIIKQSCLAYDFNQVSKNNSNFLKYQQSALKHEQNIFVSVTFFNCSPRIQPVLYRIYVYPGIRKIKWFTNNLFFLLSRRIPNKIKRKRRVFDWKKKKILFFVCLGCDAFFCLWNPTSKLNFAYVR